MTAGIELVESRPGSTILHAQAVRVESGVRQEHESPEPQAGQASDGIRQGDHVSLRAAGAGKVSGAGLQLDADLERCAVMRALRRQALGNAGRRHSLGPRKVFGDLAGLVGLYPSNEMPDCVTVDDCNFGQCFLHVVLAKVAESGLEAALYGRHRVSLADAHQGDVRAPAPGCGGCPARPGTNFGQMIRDCRHDYLLAPDCTMFTAGFGYRTRGHRLGIGMAVEIAQLLAFAVKSKASDLHLSAGVPPMIRVDGDVKRVNMPPLAHKDVHSMIYDIMNDKQRKDFEEFLETDFSFEIPNLARFRVNAYNQNRGAAAVFRTIPSIIQTLEDLKTPPIFRDISMYPRGIVLVTGPTGSGKSTTLAAMVDYINDNKPDHILTIEDPIEFVHESKRCLINQREVHKDTLGFAEALRSALREDPDVILVGEMRDLETIRLALTAAETGHLVFGTLHTSSAAKTMDRIVDVFPAQEKEMVRSMLSESLRAVISQALLKRIGGGRVAAHEIMIGTPAIRNLIREGKVAQMYSAIQTGVKEGMQTLDQCLQELLSKGVISKEEARFKAQHKDSF